MLFRSVLIVPAVGDIGLFEFYRAAESIAAGAAAATAALPEIHSALQRQGGGRPHRVRKREAH